DLALQLTIPGSAPVAHRGPGRGGDADQLLQLVANFGDSRSGTRLVLIAPHSYTDADGANGDISHFDRHTAGHSNSALDVGHRRPEGRSPRFGRLPGRCPSRRECECRVRLAPAQVDGVRAVSFVAQERLEKSTRIDDGHTHTEAVSAAPFHRPLGNSLSLF